MSFQSTLDELEAKFHSNPDPSVFLDALQRTVVEEEQRRSVKVGDTAPVFSLPDAAGNLISSTQLLEAGPLVLTFYRGLWCPYCQSDLDGFRAMMDDVTSLGASVAAISHRSESRESKPFGANVDLEFLLLEDREGDVAVKFGIRWPRDEFELIQEKLDGGLTSFRGTEPWIIPMQARFVIGQDGKIAFAEVARDYSERSEPSEILSVVRDLKRTS